MAKVEELSHDDATPVTSQLVPYAPPPNAGAAYSHALVPSPINMGALVRSHAVIRPDDAWINVLVQLYRYVAANSHALRDRIALRHATTQVDSSWSAQQLREAFITHDADLWAWLLPSFSTTCALRDNVGASLEAMAHSDAAIVGSLEDWAALENRVRKLTYFELAGSTAMVRWSEQMLDTTKTFKAAVTPPLPSPPRFSTPEAPWFSNAGWSSRSQSTTNITIINITMGHTSSTPSFLAFGGSGCGLGFGSRR